RDILDLAFSSGFYGWRIRQAVIRKDRERPQKKDSRQSHETEGSLSIQVAHWRHLLRFWPTELELLEPPYAWRKAGEEWAKRKRETRSSTAAYGFEARDSWRERWLRPRG